MLKRHPMKDAKAKCGLLSLYGTSASLLLLGSALTGRVHESSILNHHIHSTSPDHLALLHKEVNTVVSKIRCLPITPNQSPIFRMHQLLSFAPPDSLLSCDEAAKHDLLKQIMHANSSQDAYSCFHTDGPWLQPNRSTGAEAHPDQWLNYLSLAGIPLNMTIYVDEVGFTVEDLLRSSQNNVAGLGELSWTVSAYSGYCVPDSCWTNKYDDSLSLLGLTSQLLDGHSSVCRGTHRLVGLARAWGVLRFSKERWHIALAHRLQQELEIEKNLLRKERFRVPVSDDDRRDHGSHHNFLFTGHSLEWLSISCSPEELRQGWITAAVRQLTADLDAWIATSMPHEIQDDVAWAAACHAVSGLARWRVRSSQE
jgi:hypothetical protein